MRPSTGVPVVVAVDSLASMAACVVAVDGHDREAVAGLVNETNARASGASWIVTRTGIATVRSAPINASGATVRDLERIIRVAALGWGNFSACGARSTARVGVTTGGFGWGGFADSSEDRFD